MIQELEQLQCEALAQLETVGSLEALDQWRSEFTGRKGRLPTLLRGMGQLEHVMRPVVGARSNEVKQRLEACFEQKRQDLAERELPRALAADMVDVTLPGRSKLVGQHHPVTRAWLEASAVLAELGFQPYRSREVELDEYNFQLLNFPLHHPAREMQDSFYVRDGGTESNPVLLRTQTSPGQIHAMREAVEQARAAGCAADDLPPVRIMLMGTVYRYEQVSPSKDVQFKQIEGLAVGKSITMGDLRGTLARFVRILFGPERRMRFRSSYFPFTEPSAEVDLDCVHCDGKGCRVCKHIGWQEILGCGMVHPVVLRNGGYDPDLYSGFAFGLGLERIALQKYGVEDIRLFRANDLRFLEQFG